MIVCNESHVIERALLSVKHLVDYWVICDTGSTDDTPACILKAMQGKPGELHRVPWVNFGHNRTQVIRLAKDKADYSLIMDADMIANIYAPFKSRLSKDYYEIRYEGDVDYSQPMLVSNAHDWQYMGVTHEYINAPGAKSWEVLRELTLTHLADGGMRSDKLERDIRLLTAALAADPENPRDMFYLAQSYKDLDQYEDAICWYERRAQYEGWDEERWYAMYQLARMKHLAGRNWEEVLNAYLAAYGARPSRMEPLYEIVRHYREHSEFHTGYLFAANAGHSIHYPADLLFIDRPVYTYLFLLEYAVCAYGVGRISEAIRAFNEVLLADQLPEWVAGSAARGRKMALERLYVKTGDAVHKENRMIVITPFRNAGDSLRKCLESLCAQDYRNYQIILVDDASTDNSCSYIPAGDARIRLVTNEERKGGAWNIHHAITNYCEPDDIVVCVDGDDWLADEQVLVHINQVYNDYDCWVMYGQFQAPDGTPGFSYPFYSELDFSALRKSWRTSHLRTFRAGLFFSIADQDPDYACLKDDKGRWLTSAVDAALMFPILEMAGFRRVVFNDKVLYIYNDQHPGNIFRNDRDQQRMNFEMIQRKRPFAHINSYHPAAAFIMNGEP